MTPTSVELAASQMSIGNFLFADQRCHWRFEGKQGESRNPDDYQRLLSWVPLVALNLRHCGPDKMLT
jgi:hypothetical protein